MSHLVLPPELIDHILLFLQNDTQTLCACARVCREWLPACRTHLYDNISFRTPRSYTAFVDQVVFSPRMQPYLERVRGLAVVSPDGFVNRYLAPRFLHDMHGALPHLRLLRISHVDWERLVTSDTWKLFDAHTGSPFPRLTKLAITHAVLPSDRVLAQLVVSLPSLTSLSLRSLSFRSPWIPQDIVLGPGAARNRSRTLETLWVDGSDEFVGPFLAWFVEHFPETRVSLRELGCTPKRWVPATSDLLNALGPTSALSTLLMPFPSDHADAEPVSLAHLTHLARLNVLLMGERPSPVSWTRLARMLDSLGWGARAQGLSIALCYYPTTPADWVSLDDSGGLELLDPVLAKLASKSSSGSPSAIPASDHYAGAWQAGERPDTLAFNLKFACYVHQPKGSRVTKDDIDGIVRRKLMLSAERGVVCGRLMRTFPSMDL